MLRFADLPARIEALTREHERVALILLDAFGMKFVERHASHPLLERLEIVGTSGAGLVKVTVNGKNETRKVEIDTSLFVPADKGVVEDLVVAAANDARQKVEQMVQEQMKTITGGLPLPPGFKL